MRPERHERGDVHPVTGLVFWQYHRGRAVEAWVTAEEFARRKAAHKASNHAHYVANKARYCAQRDRWVEKNLEHARKCRRLRAILPGNRMKANAASLRWKKENPERFREAARRRRFRKRHTDILHRLKVNCRTRIRGFVRSSGINKPSKTMAMIGCTTEFLRAHLESKFTPGMTWENYGLWEIDHEIPLASAKTSIDLLLLCHFTNLQPLWKAQNREKGARVC